ncbi:7-cyano-7-deazaguanine synthase QueC [bacterium]|nr:7-cyano-7-deazaguanine synthase QueC [bacterium]
MQKPLKRLPVKKKSSKELAVILVSGGMDSCVTAAIAAQSYELAMLHLNYGQKTERREEKAFRDICKFYRIPRDRQLISHIDHLKKIGGSSLTDRAMEVSKANLKNKKVPTSYVPFRNSHILAIAVSWAEVIGAKKIFIGAVEEDSSGYPDCREDYFKAFNRVIALGTRPDTTLEIITPIIHMNKSEIVRKGVELKAPLHLTWSCYQNEVKACGACDSCALRLRGFQSAGVEDPIIYKQIIKYK